MKKLQKHFNTYTTATKVKFVIVLPVLCLASVLGNLIDVLGYIIRWMWNFVRWNWKQLTVIAIAAVIVATPILTIIHIDQTVPRFRGESKEQAMTYVYTNCHEMTNNFIVAVDGSVRGHVRADDDNIDRILAIVVEYGFSDQSMLIEWLLQFKAGNYSEAVRFHNYCWEKLDGEIGYAEDLKNRYK